LVSLCRLRGASATCRLRSGLGDRQGP